MKSYTKETMEKAKVNTAEDIAHIMKENDFSFPLSDLREIVTVVQELLPLYEVDEIEQNGNDFYLQASYYSDTIEHTIIIDQDWNSSQPIENMKDFIELLFNTQERINALEEKMCIVK